MLYSAQNIDKRYPPPFRWLERWALRHASALSVCNSEAGRICERKGFPGAATLIPLGVDTERFSPGSEPARPAPVIGYVGRLEPHKGVDVLLEALADVDGAVLRVAGAGPEESRLRARTTALSLDDRVELVGSLTQEQLPGFYRGLDVLVVPSRPTPGWLEQFGRVVVEATGVRGARRRQRHRSAPRRGRRRRPAGAARTTPRRSPHACGPCSATSPRAASWRARSGPGSPGVVVGGRGGLPRICTSERRGPR